MDVWILTRDQFREGVFERDHHLCVVCKQFAVDAHHIMERRLFPDGGYYLDNGASVCETHHLQCESTQISTEEIRLHAQITQTVLPPHLYHDTVYDKWGNPVTESGRRLRGELFYDPSVQKALRLRFGHLLEQEFSKYVKYPRTYHLPWSPTPSKDDKTQSNTDSFVDKRVIVTEKMDGENTTMYDDYIHARSVDGRSHPSRDWVKNFHAEHVAYQIDHRTRICGENLFAEHSIAYTLESYFLGFAMWEDDVCLSWDDTVVYLALLDIQPVPVLYDGIFDISQIQEATKGLDFTKSEGYVLRLADSFRLRDFSISTGKFVRPNHVRTTKHWMYGQPVKQQRSS